MSKRSPGVDPRIQEAQTLIREWRETKSRVAIKKAAAVIVSLRAEHIDAFGMPDLTGSSPEWWKVAEQIFEGYSKEERIRTRSALGYHIGQLLRDTISDDEIEAYGLLKTSPNERQLARWRVMQSAAESSGAYPYSRSYEERLQAALTVLQTIPTNLVPADDIRKLCNEVSRISESGECSYNGH